VYGNQPSTALFPAGLNIGLRGMCIGERRLVSIPPSLAFGEKGMEVKSMKIPPNSYVIYDIELISINGLTGDE